MASPIPRLSAMPITALTRESHAPLAAFRAPVQSPLMIAMTQSNRFLRMLSPCTTALMAAPSRPKPTLTMDPRISPKFSQDAASEDTSTPKSLPIADPRELMASMSLSMAGVMSSVNFEKSRPSQKPVKRLFTR